MQYINRLSPGMLNVLSLLICSPIALSFRFHCRGSGFVQNKADLRCETGIDNSGLLLLDGTLRGTHYSELGGIERYA